MQQFSYLLDKLERAKFIDEPFKHIELQGFLNSDHFDELLHDQQLHFGPCANKYDLLENLHRYGYEPVKFPGCTENVDAYFNSLEFGRWENIHRDLRDGELQGFGITYRLRKYHSPLLRELMNFLNGPDFKHALMTKFEISEDTVIFTAVHKYLTKYEISPHPDIRQKALTYLLNINRDDACERYSMHTHLLSFKKEFAAIYDYWEKNTNENRAWVPWKCCDIIKTISKNNSIVLFRPGSRSLHAVRLNYDHYALQRTQIYGNLMFEKHPTYTRQSYEDLLSFASATCASS